jgi:drug/metabolite transporter (DMT)-like permease
MKISQEKIAPAPMSAATPASSGYFKGMIACIVAALLFGTMFPVMTHALTHIDPFSFTALRYLIGGAAFLIFLRLREGSGAFSLDGHSGWLAWLLGSIGFCGFGSFVFLGQQLAGPEGALTASIMMATQPMIGLLVNSAMKRTAPPLPAFLFILMSFTGIALVVTKGDLAALLSAPRNYSANALIVVGAACWVVYTFSGAYFPRWSALKYTTVTLWLGMTTIVGLAALLLATGIEPVPSRADLIAIAPDLLYMGPIAGFIAVLMWITGNKILTPLNGVLFVDIVPITTFTVSALTGVVPSAGQLIGAGLSGTALILNNLYLRRRAARG